jgi:hypothetical protein
MSPVTLLRIALIPLLGAAALAALTACTTNEERQQASIACPQPMLVLDASRLTRFREGRGRDPTDVMLQAAIGDIDLRCSADASRIDIDLKLRIAAAEGPALSAQGARVATVRYFVAVIDPNRNVVTRTEFPADFQFLGNRTRLTSLEELTHRIPLVKDQPTLGYQVAVGFVLSHEEVDYNRRASARR